MKAQAAVPKRERGALLPSKEHERLVQGLHGLGAKDEELRMAKPLEKQLPPIREELLLTTTLDKDITHKQDQDRKTKALKEKDEGNGYFAKGQIQKAVEHYTAAILLDPQLVTALGNRAQCYIRLKNWQRAIEDCTAALSVEKANVKNLLRRAVAYKNVGKLQEALEDLEQVLLLESNNKQAIQQLDELKKMTRPPQTPLSPTATFEEEESENTAPLLVPKSTTRTTTTTTPLPISTTQTPITTSKTTTAPTQTTTLQETPLLASTTKLPEGPPTSLYDLEKVWNSLKGDQAAYSDATTARSTTLNLFYAYLMRVPVNMYSSLFKGSVTTELFNTILSAVATCSSKDPPAQTLEVLSGIARHMARFDILTLCLSSAQQKELSALLEELSKRVPEQQQTIHNIRSSYSL
ncbi:Hsp90 cochaperone [Balamuthia mandrillaris]